MEKQLFDEAHKHIINHNRAKSFKVANQFALSVSQKATLSQLEKEFLRGTTQTDADFVERLTVFVNHVKAEAAAQASDKDYFDKVNHAHELRFSKLEPVRFQYSNFRNNEDSLENFYFYRETVDGALKRELEGDGRWVFLKGATLSGKTRCAQQYLKEHGGGKPVFWVKNLSTLPENLAPNASTSAKQAREAQVKSALDEFLSDKGTAAFFLCNDVQDFYQQERNDAFTTLINHLAKEYLNVKIIFTAVKGAAFVDPQDTRDEAKFLLEAYEPFKTFFPAPERDPRVIDIPTYASSTPEAREDFIAAFKPQVEAHPELSWPTALDENFDGNLGSLLMPIDKVKWTIAHYGKEPEVWALFVALKALHYAAAYREEKGQFDDELTLAFAYRVYCHESETYLTQRQPPKALPRHDEASLLNQDEFEDELYEKWLSHLERQSDAGAQLLDNQGGEKDFRTEVAYIGLLPPTTTKKNSVKIQSRLRAFTEALFTQQERIELGIFSRQYELNQKINDENTTAQEVLDELSKTAASGTLPDVVTYNTVLKKINQSTEALSYKGKQYSSTLPLALELLDEMRARGLKPDEITYNTLFKQIGRWAQEDAKARSREALALVQKYVLQMQKDGIRPQLARYGETRGYTATSLYPAIRKKRKPFLDWLSTATQALPAHQQTPWQRLAEELAQM